MISLNIISSTEEKISYLNFIYTVPVEEAVLDKVLDKVDYFGSWIDIEKNFRDVINIPYVFYIFLSRDN